MYSDDNYLSKSEFYHPNEVNFVVNNPISASTSHIEHANSGEITSDVQDFILSKRRKNTLEKTKYYMNIWKRYFKAENELRGVERILAEELNEKK